jgi:hypothetical protein
LKSLRGPSVEAAYARDDWRPAWHHYRDVVREHVSSRISRSLRPALQPRTAR